MDGIVCIDFSDDYNAGVAYVSDMLPEESLLIQLEEECGEFLAATAKLRRVREGLNPTPVGLEEAKRHVREEIADVANAVEVLLAKCDTGEYADIMEAKMKRWVKRLREVE